MISLIRDATDAVEMQMACTQCYEPLDVKKSLFVQEAGDYSHISILAISPFLVA